MSDEHKSAEERIRERAYALWEREGRPEDREREHWEQAARELQDGGGGEVRRSTTQGEGRPSVDRLTPAEATSATTGAHQDGAARRPGSAAEAQTRKPL